MAPSDPNLWTEEDEIWSTIHQRSHPHSAACPYERGALLGSGGWCVVHRVRRRSAVEEGSQSLFAGKSPRSTAAEDVAQTVRKMKREVEILQSLHHDHIIKLVDFYYNETCPQSCLLVTEICREGSLQTLISYAAGAMDAESIWKVMSQVNGALGYLHGKGLFHSDVKPSNIMVRHRSPALEVVLADCADVMAIIYDNGDGEDGVSSAAVPHGTELFYSPHLVQHGRYAGSSDDMWALGMCLLGMMGQWPLVDCDDDGASRYPKMCFDHAAQLVRLNGDHEMVGLLERLLTWRREERADTREVEALVNRVLQRDDASAAAHQAARDGGGRNKLGIKTVKGFEVVEFW